MSMEDAKRFIEDSERDQKLLEQVKAVAIDEHETGTEFFARVAKGLGYDFTADEITEALKAKQEAAERAIREAELDDGELEQVAGGADECSFDYSCYRSWHWKKARPSCESTFGGGYERCWYSDECEVLFNSY